MAFTIPLFAAAAIGLMVLHSGARTQAVTTIMPRVVGTSLALSPETMCQMLLQFPAMIRSSNRPSSTRKPRLHHQPLCRRSPNGNSSQHRRSPLDSSHKLHSNQGKCRRRSLLNSHRYRNSSRFQQRLLTNLKLRNNRRPRRLPINITHKPRNNKGNSSNKRRPRRSSSRHRPRNSSKSHASANNLRRNGVKCNAIGSNSRGNVDF